MSLIDRWRHRWRALFHGEDVRREREAEVAFHLSLGAQQAEGRGATPVDAVSEARREFGNATAVQEEARAVSRSAWLDQAVQDVRYALRAFRRSPGYAVGAALTLALGVGATSAVFSIFETLVLRAVPYGDAGQLFVAGERGETGAFRTPSYPTFQDWRADSAAWKPAISGMAFMRGDGVWLSAADGDERVLVSYVTPGFFPLMRTAPLLGRTFVPSEESASGERTVVLSYDVWRRYYGGDPAIVNRVVPIDSAPTRVIGVMPQGFSYPQWSNGIAGSTGMWASIAQIEQRDVTLSKRGDHADSYVVVRAVADSARATAALSLAQARQADTYPADAKGWRAAVLFSVRNGILGNVRLLLQTLGGAVALVLLLACVNVASLALVRGAARARELAVRAALGAARTRVIRQLLTESIIIGIAGAGGGVALAVGVLAATRRLAADQLVGAQNVGVDWTVMLFAAGVAIAASILAGLMPAFRSTSAAPVRTIRSGGQSSTGGRGDARIRSALVVVQLALALVLLVGTGLLVRSFRNVGAIQLPFEPKGLITTTVFPPARYATANDTRFLYESLIDRIRAVPGVVDVGLMNNAALTTPIVPEGHPMPAEGTTAITPRYRVVSEGYLPAMKMRMASGRWFTTDDMRARDRFVINEALAREMFPRESPIGQRVTALRRARVRADFGQPISGTIVGVIHDNEAQDGGGPGQAEVLVPYTLETWAWAQFAIRAVDVPRAIPLIREAIRQVDPAITAARASGKFNGVHAVTEDLVSGRSRRRLVTSAMAAFAFAALVLAAIGMYSVMSYGVSLRTREVGVRVALGATQGAIFRLVIGEGMQLAAIGTVIGSLGALAATRLIQAMLVGMKPTDVPTYAMMAGILLATAVVACYLPARRAARLSPTDAIRGD